MDQTNNTPDQTPTAETTPETPERRSPLGPIIGATIVLLVAAFGGLYIWGSANMHDSAVEEDVAQTEEMSTTTEESTDIEDLEAELEADFADFEADLADIDAAFEGDAQMETGSE